MGVIKLHTANERLIFDTKPVITSGNININSIEITLCKSWLSLGENTDIWAVFYKDEKDKYKMPLENGSCLIPNIMLAKKGFFYFGIYAVDKNGKMLKTSMVKDYEVKQGAPTDGVFGSFEGEEMPSFSEYAKKEDIPKYIWGSGLAENDGLVYVDHEQVAFADHVPISADIIGSELNFRGKTEMPTGSNQILFSVDISEITGGSKIEVDGTLSQDGTAADAKAVGDEIATINNRLALLSNYVTPQMFGAVGDGVADDTEAVQAALDNGGLIYFPAGRYKTTRLLTVSKSCRIEMFKQYPNTYKKEYPLTPEDNCMGARIDTYSPEGGMLIGDAVEVDGLYIRAMEGFAGVVLKFDNTIGAYTYPAAARLKHIKLEIDSPNTIPVSMFDFLPDGSYHYILEDICLGRNGDAGYCEYGFRTDMTQTARKWANNVTIRNLCIDLHADYPLYVDGSEKQAVGWLFETLTIQGYRYNTEGNAENNNILKGHKDIITLKNARLTTFISSYIWDLGQATVLGNIFSVDNVTGTAVIGCSEDFYAIEDYYTPKMKLPQNLNIANLEMTVEDSIDGTANTLILFDGANEKTVDIPKVEMDNEQIGNAIGTWMDANAQPKEVAGRNKFNYASEYCIMGEFRKNSLGVIVIDTPAQNPVITSWITNYIEVRNGDVIRTTVNGNSRNPYKICVYNANKELIELLSGFVYEHTVNGIKIELEDAAFIRIEFNTSTFGTYEDRSTAQILVTINDPDRLYEDYYTELVGGIGSFMALQSPNGTKFTLAVNDDGTLYAEQA